MNLELYDEESRTLAREPLPLPHLRLHIKYIYAQKVGNLWTKPPRRLPVFLSRMFCFCAEAGFQSKAPRAGGGSGEGCLRKGLVQGGECRCLRFGNPYG